MSRPPAYDESRAHRPRRPSRDRTVALIAICFAVVATIVAVVLAVLLLQRSPASSVGASVDRSAAAKSSPPVAKPTPSEKPAQPRTRAAVRSAAEEVFDAYAAGEYGPFWDMWTSQAKEVVSRKDYVRRFRLCPSVAQGLRFEIQKVTVAGNRATVRTARSILVQTYRFAYQEGEWRYSPLPEQLAPYRTKTVDQIVREEKAAGACGDG